MFALAVWISDTTRVVSPQPMIIAGVLLYAATIFGLGRAGVEDIREAKTAGLVDSLTGLPNRRALHTDFSEHATPGEEVALALLDLDSFKQVNDHFGHLFGDQLIDACAKILKELCGQEAHCYRLGGDEFAIMKVGPVAGTIVESICRKIIEQLSKPISMEERSIAVGVSIGLSRSSGRDGISSSELLRRSDVAMYASKRGGRMRCTWFSEDFDRDREAVRELDNELRSALANEEFRVFYQPLVDADTHKIVAVEALLRWDRPDGEPIGPNIFIPVAEESGLINAIGLWVLRRACTDAMAWGDITLSVNISAAQLRNPEFPVQLGYILEETNFPPHRLDLEVTETCLVLDPVVAERSLNVIREFGVNVSLDDFGTGYASIGFLRQFRFEKLKLDRSLVVQAGMDDGSRAMMLSSIAMARALKMGVTAEGVETEDQATLVRTAGCDQIQGWLFYKAMPFGEVEALIGAQNDMMGRQRAGRGNAA
ncbi:bifunctional diguanylate cyclase/phosphodiesterase [Altererythrobacter arenosus]|uniref:Bifunctional diguanylate cyclase/phosphodiesterase n=1 Tax=Altererythrobacter arenosus TaxID=3032592 RepID=A0ABY8FW44_9SPHN|nr:bifunctional diguanylate cyclase/phosphodiesterase [Altererythrobacter sp. CAU 1644]WFL78183.1 bifunctional diguanylate cyclase/phosphodiesterase [Altererythrobacter sp. CAU 1644]